MKYRLTASFLKLIGLILVFSTAANIGLSQPIKAKPALRGRLAFTRNVDGRAHVFSANLDGTGMQQLTHGAHNNRAPNWSSVGRQIAFVPWEAGEKFNGREKRIYVMNRDGSVLVSSGIRNIEGSFSWWAAPDCPPVNQSQNQKLQTGATAQICVYDNGLSLRTAPGKDMPAAEKLPYGLVVKLLEGPCSADGFQWWHVRTPSGTEGWVVESADKIRTLVLIS